MSNIDEVKELLARTTKEVERNKWNFYKKYPYSMSKIVNQLKPEFDQQGMAQKTHDKHFYDRTSIYYGKTVDEILQMWAKKSELGKMYGKILDDYIGLVLERKATEQQLADFLAGLDKTANLKCNTWMRFYRSFIGPEAGDNRIEFICREMTMCDDRYGLNGRLDALFGFKDKALLIDWKNTEKITTESRFETMLGPLYKYDNCSLNEYTIQLYSYVYMLTHDYGLDRRIVPLIINITLNEHLTFRPIIPYSDTLMEECFDYAIAKIKKAKEDANKQQADDSVKINKESE